jgi:N-glycosylase/DNA lyase
MKCFDLLHKAATGRYVVIEDAPIIVDLRIARVSLASGLIEIPGTSVVQSLQNAPEIASSHHQEIVKAWRDVQRQAGGLSLFRIDSLVWQVAEPIYEERHKKTRAIERVAKILTAFGMERRSATLVANELTASLR